MNAVFHRLDLIVAAVEKNGLICTNGRVLQYVCQLLLEALARRRVQNDEEELILAELSQQWVIIQGVEQKLRLLVLFDLLNELLAALVVRLRPMLNLEVVLVLGWHD